MIRFTYRGHECAVFYTDILVAAALVLGLPAITWIYHLITGARFAFGV